MNLRVSMATVLLACSLACGLPATAAASPRVRLLSSVDGGPATAEWKYARVGQAVTLVAQLDGPRRFAGARWYRLEPAVGAVDNTQPSFHYEAIPYARVEVAACRDQPRCPADVTPSDPDLLGGVAGVGTMAFQVELTLEDGTVLATPGPERTVQGGLAPEVHRVTFRRDDSYLGHLTELFHTPYIFGSEGPQGRHQAELLIGSDCADLAVYGARRVGLAVPWVSTWTIDRHAREVFRATHAVGGVAHSAQAEPIAIGERGARPGDLLLFPGSRHVGVLYEDRPPLGVLDGADLLLHTCWAPPRVEPIDGTGCASYPIRVLRFDFRELAQDRRPRP